jgi:hypothetical protein
MAEHKRPLLPSAAASSDPALGDRDVNVQAVWIFLGCLAGATALVFAVVWALSAGFRDDLVASDPEPHPLAEATRSQPPPEPRLQEAPPKDLAAHRAREDEELTTWGWVDKERGVARIPIERAIDIAAEKNLPAPATSGQEGSLRKP